MAVCNDVKRMLSLRNNAICGTMAFARWLSIFTNLEDKIIRLDLRDIFVAGEKRRSSHGRSLERHYQWHLGLKIKTVMWSSFSTAEVAGQKT